LLDACRSAGIRVPDDVAVVGVDNDALLCELADPPMTSVAPDTHRTGYMAAELLERMLQGRRTPGAVHLVAPLGVVTRRSSDALAIDDPDVSSSLRFIREHACEGIRIADLLRRTPISRRILEARFKQLLGRSPHQEIMRCKIERVKELLRDTDLPLKAIAKKIGVAHTEYLSVTFKRMTGQTPSDFRRSTRDLSIPA
jgi:LacI family transcriptional regulator